MGAVQARIADSRLQKRSQHFICTHNVTLSVAAMCVGNEDCSGRWNQFLRRSPNAVGESNNDVTFNTALVTLRTLKRCKKVKS